MPAQPDFSAFRKGFDAGQSQLVWRWLDADLDTPVSVWLKLCQTEEHSFLLESVEGGASLGRYSVIGLSPDFQWRYEAGIAATKTKDAGWCAENGAPLESLKRAIRSSRIDLLDESLPPMAGSGLFGYLGYDMIRLVENIPD